MTLSPKDLARALYLAVREASDKDAPAIVANLTEVARSRGLAASLPEVLALLPAVMEEEDAKRRVTVESGYEMSAKDANAALAAAGVTADPDDVVRTVVPELLGGFRIRTPNQVIDASIRGTIQELSRRLTES